MWKAVRRLVRTGVLGAAHRSGIRIIQAAPQPEPAGSGRRQTASAPNWIAISDRICSDITAGRFAHRPLLQSPKQLCLQYGVCFRTIRKSLDRLAGDGWIERYKRTYRVTLTQAPGAGSAIFLVMNGDSDGHLLRNAPRARECLRALETECARRQATLELLLYDIFRDRLYSPGRQTTVLDAPEHYPAVLGFIFWPTAISASRICAILRRLVAQRRPVAVFDEVGDVSLPPSLGAADRVARFTMANTTRAAKQVARHLIALGHRSIAYVSTLHGSVWSKNRYQGLTETYAQAGHAAGVTALTDDGAVLPPDFWQEVRRVHDELDALETRKSRRSASARISLERTIDALQEQIRPLMEWEMSVARLRPLLQRALDDRRLTAWVAANDETALECLRFLREHGRDVPAEVSVIGFDDTPEAFERKLTSYNFNGPLVMAAMVSHILEPRLPARSGGAVTPVEVEGVIVSRRTTAQAPFFPLSGRRQRGIL